MKSIGIEVVDNFQEEDEIDDAEMTEEELNNKINKALNSPTTTRNKNERKTFLED
ncbi:hypothetical protein AB4865_02115 [Capnocytophaga sp. ARDL2]|uniref:hypothetical protein n=1 Tax=Capnocytophaga sp. ARDL2 TaxID=3238809 RepID=UPI003556AD69